MTPTDRKALQALAKIHKTVAASASEFDLDALALEAQARADDCVRQLL